MVALPNVPLPQPPSIPPLPGGNVVPFPIGPQDVVDLNEGEAIAEVFKIGAAGELPALAAVAELAIPLYVGARVETALLNNEHWDNFWIGIGGKLNDVWHSATDFLFGGQGVSLDTVGQMIQLSAAQSRRFTRQLYTKITAYAAASQATTSKLAMAVARGLSALDAKVNNVGNFLGAQIENYYERGKHYTDVISARVEARVNKRILDTAAGVEHWASANIAKPLLHEIGKVEHELHGLEDGLGRIIDSRVHAIIDSPIAHLTALSAAAALAIKALEKEATDCGVPICETVGPKTDWGKWLKRFAPTAIWLMLAEVAAENPDAVRDAATGLADALGPVLSVWVEQWALGNFTDFGGQPKPVTGAIGHNPLEI